MSFARKLGIAGVDAHETESARRWAHRLEWPMLIVSMFIPVLWYLEVAQVIGARWSNLIDWLIWSVFFVETALLVALVSNKMRYLKSNWMNVLIIVFGFPLVWQGTPLAGLMRSLRLVLVVVALGKMMRILRKLLSMHQLGTTLGLAFLTIVLGGVIISRIDPSIGDAWDGIWWAWVTIATVGYGDVVPHTGAGRLFASFLILFGVVLLSILTANIAAFLIGGEVARVEKKEDEADRLLKEISARLERVERMLEERQRSGH